MVYGTFQVHALGGPLSLGTFLATINVFKEIGLELQEIYAEMMEIQTTFAPLRKITFFMNFPTDLAQRMSVNRERRRVGHIKAAQAREEHNPQGGSIMMTDRGDLIFAVDTIPIEFEALTFKQNEKQIMTNVSMQFAQGKFYAFVGPPRQGKATLLKLIGQVLVPSPSSGYVIVPPHLRVLHISKDPHVLDESLLRNVLLTHQSSTDIKTFGGMERVKDICKIVGFRNSMMALLDEEPKEDVRQRCDWVRKFSSTDHARLNLARAFVHNPECLVMHMPVITFSDEEAKDMMALLQKHVRERGLALPDRDRKYRRPRTVFVSASALARCGNADVIYSFNRGELSEHKPSEADASTTVQPIAEGHKPSKVDMKVI